MQPWFPMGKPVCPPGSCVPPRIDWFSRSVLGCIRHCHADRFPVGVVVWKSWPQFVPSRAVVGSSQKAPACQGLALHSIWIVNWAGGFLLQVARGQPAAIAPLEVGGKVSVLKGAGQGLPTPRFSGSGLKLQMWETSFLFSVVMGGRGSEAQLDTPVLLSPAGLRPRAARVSRGHCKS